MNYYANSGAFDDLCAFRNILTIINDYDVKDRGYKQEIEDLKAKILELQRRPCNSSGKSMETPVDLQTHCVIRTEYLLYIQKYGVPEDGVFLPSLLEQLVTECGTDPDDTQLNHDGKTYLLPDTDVFGYGGKITDLNRVVDFSNLLEITEITL